MEQSIKQPEIKWPAIIQFSGDAELIYLDALPQFENLINDPHTRFEDNDRLIDVSGKIFLFDKQKSLVPITETISLENLLGLVKQHLSEQGSCCVAKLYAPSIEAAFQLLNSSISCETDF